MKSIRKGKSIQLTMSVLTQGEKLPLEGRDISLELTDPFGRTIVLPINVSGSVLAATFPPEQQRTIGQYIVTVWEDKGKDSQVPVDIVPAFRLVRWTTDEGGEDDPNLQVETVDLGTVDIGTADMGDVLFAVDEVNALSDSDYLVVRTANGIRKITAANLRNYCNYGLTHTINTI